MSERRKLRDGISAKRLEHLLSCGLSLSKSAKEIGITYAAAKAMLRGIKND